MTDLRRAGRAGVLLPIALIFAACSGGSGASASANSNAGASGAPNPPAASTAGGGAEPSGSGPNLALPSFDLGQLTQGLANLDSYKVAITVGDASVYSGTVVTKPVPARDITVQGNTRIVVIGDNAWVAEGGGKLTAVPTSLATQMFAAIDPTGLVGAFSGAGFGENSTLVGSEQKNGVDTKHYRIDSNSFIGALTSLAPGSTIDVWIANDGYLVAVETTGMASGQNVSIQVTNVNDPANKVDTPS